MFEVWMWIRYMQAVIFFYMYYWNFDFIYVLQHKQSLLKDLKLLNVKILRHIRYFPEQNVFFLKLCLYLIKTNFLRNIKKIYVIHDTNTHREWMKRRSWKRKKRKKLNWMKFRTFFTGESSRYWYLYTFSHLFYIYFKFIYSFFIV